MQITNSCYRNKLNSMRVLSLSNSRHTGVHGVIHTFLNTKFPCALFLSSPTSVIFGSFLLLLLHKSKPDHSECLRDNSIQITMALSLSLRDLTRRSRSPMSRRTSLVVYFFSDLCRFTVLCFHNVDAYVPQSSLTTAVC